MREIIVAGAGMAGLSTAIRLAQEGFTVTVIDQQQQAGGKLGELSAQGFRFDTGPSLFTMPHLVTDLLGDQTTFRYQRLDTLCHYFFADGSRFQAPGHPEDFIREAAAFFGESEDKIRRYLAKSAFLYRITAPVFLERSLHRLSTYTRGTGIRGILNLPRLGIFNTMASVNEKSFSDPRAVQYFNRFATYNGSDPWQAPATLNVIPHLETSLGAYYPAGGMISIARHLEARARELGVTFRFGEKISAIRTSNGRVDHIETAQGEQIRTETLVSNLDVRLTYRLMQSEPPPRINRAEPSSSALIFYWGINRSFPELHLHNIFFSADYRNEFNHIFNQKDVGDDPTIYLNITSKMEPDDAPEGGENWFILVNTPHDSGQNWDDIRKKVRESVIRKLNRMLNTDLNPHIVFEDYLDPWRIASVTGSTFGSLYGSSSNNRLSAFFRQPNFSGSVKGLYFCGGSAHPGGGIPLCLLGGKITSELVKEDFHETR